MEFLRWLLRFRACRILFRPHCHVNGLCQLIPAEWEMMRNQRSTYVLYVKFKLWEERTKLNRSTRP